MEYEKGESVRRCRIKRFVDSSDYYGEDFKSKVVDEMMKEATENNTSKIHEGRKIMKYNSDTNARNATYRT